MEPILPVAEKVSYNGVIVDENKVFSKLLGTNKTDEPDFEEKNVEAIKSHVKPNDEVLIIGGGVGRHCILCL
jgi:spermidine synthase